MNWFVAKLIFEIKSEDSNYPQFDEQLRLIDAVNEELALEMAHQIGLMQQQSITNGQNHSVNWTFIAVTELEHIGNIAHGQEIHYKITEPDAGTQYLAMVQLKAQQLKERTHAYTV